MKNEGDWGKSLSLRKNRVNAINSSVYGISPEKTGQKRDTFSWAGETPAQEKKMVRIQPLTRIQKRNTLHPEFYPPRLVEGKIWYIVYYVADPYTNELTRVRIKFNRIPNIGQRRQMARALMRTLTEKLESGWNPLISGDEKKTYTPISQALEDYIKAKEHDAEENSMRVYRSLVKFIRSWMEDSGLSTDLPVNQFSDEMAADVMEGLKMSDIGPRTYNNYLRGLKTLWNWFIEYRYARLNPFRDFKPSSKRMLQKKIRVLLTLEDRKALFNLLEKSNPNFLCICLLCYYCFIRPKEIVLLKVKDLDLEKQCVYISREIAKNDKDSIRTIPDAAMPFFQQLQIRKAEADEFLFSWDGRYDFIPGTNQCCSRELARYWDRYVRAELGWGLDKQFYSLKDSGMTDMSRYMALPLVQGQADHSSLAITSIYIQKKMEVQEQIRTQAKKFTE